MNKNYFTSIIPIKTLKTFCFLLVISFSFSVSSYSQQGVFTSSGSLEIPAGVGVPGNLIKVQAWGAGGGGGGADKILGILGLAAAGGGGGGGAFNLGDVSVGTSPDNVRVNYTVGEGGSGEISSSNRNGSPGGITSFPVSTVPFFSFTSVVANGGSGGKKGGLLAGLYGEGGEGGVGQYSGGKGNSASLLGVGLTLVSGGGGGAGSNGDGNNSTNSVLSKPGGAGGVGAVGNETGGKGGDGLIGLASNGIDGNAPGGGGGGSSVLLSVSLANTKGGKGGNGQIKVTYTCPIYSVLSLTADANCSQTSDINLTGNLPRGKYYVTYEKTFQGTKTVYPDVEMKVSIAGNGKITVTGLPTVGLTKIEIKSLRSVDCTTADINKSIIIGKPEAPAVVGTVTQPTCASPTGSVDLSGFSDLSSWTINATPTTAGLTGLTGAGTSTTISGLTPGTNYSFTVTNGICTSEPFSVEINPLPIRTWDGSNWTPGTPTIEDKAIFTSNYDKNESVTACSCQVRSGANVTFKSGHYLKLRNELIVDGSLTFKDNASLVQINDVNKNTGVITYERKTKVSRYDYTYWSSPVKGWTLKELSKNTLFDRYFSYNPDKGWEVSMSGAATMEGRYGYIVRGPQTYSTTEAADFTGKFTGIPNNGAFENDDLMLKGNKDYLLGNPYPSAIDADQFLNANLDIYSGSNLIKPPVLKGTLYFWTHNSPPVADQETTTYKYTASDYASYNKTGGVTTKSAATTGGNPPSGKIAAGQGFFAPTSENGGKIVFNNSMRLLNDEVLDNSQFFKQATTSKSTDGVEKNRVWLNLTNEEGAFKQTLIGYITGATNGYEGSFDGVSYDGNQYVDFYSINQELNLSIQGRALPFQQKDSVALGYKTAISGNFKISIDHVDGAMTSQKVFLEDKTTQVLHDLKEPYTFTTEKGIFNNRFVLRYEDKNAVIEDINDVAVEGVLISSKNKIITINTTDEIIKTIHVYDFSGRLVYSDTEVNVTAATISNLSNAAQALIVQVVLENGKKAVKKIIY